MKCEKFHINLFYMKDASLQQLSKRERQIMDIIYQYGNLTAQEVRDKMEDPPGYATVRKILGILEEKGYLKHSKSGRQYVYEATIAPEKIRKKSLNHVLKTFFQGSISEAVASFLDHSDQHLTDEELDELESLIATAKDKR